ncbi:MAG: MerR family transcriptional regulator [Chloroflexi bacterium]|nr:MerR family transcriptional regulator [Chloroflexota bacterium]
MPRQPEAGRLRIAELVKATGVPKSTILFYLANGLIPEPERPKPNVALYSPVCVDLINYIRSAQQIHRYPLSWIKVNVRHIMNGAPPEDLLLLGARIMGKPTTMRGLDEVSALTNVASEDIRRYIDLGLVWPTSQLEFDDYDMRLIEVLSRAESQGLPAEAFVAVAKILEQVEQASADIVDTYVTNPFSATRASVLVDVLGRLQPYLLHRYLENRQE